LAVDNLLPFVVAAFLTALLANVLIPQLFPAADATALGRFRALFERTAVLPLCTWLFLAHLTYVVQRYLLRVRPDFDVIDADMIRAGSDALTEEDIEGLAQRAIETEISRGGTLLTRRLLLLVAQIAMMPPDKTGLMQALRARSRTDHDRAMHAYLLPTVLAAATAVLGVVGALALIASDARAGQGAEGAGGMGVDLAIVAVMGGILAFLVQEVTRSIELRLLCDVEDYLAYRLLSRLDMSRLKTAAKDGSQHCGPRRTPQSPLSLRRRASGGR
jgi:hypothetical protein